MSNIYKNRIPSLDGLRAISILFVILGHSSHFISRYVDVANLGVRVFFVISAYLIVGILLRDVEKARFSIKTFYFKRFARIFPAFYVYLLVLFFVLIGFNLFEWEQFWRAPFFLENYHSRTIWNNNQWFVGHTWSLAVEEQFYILVALLFLFFSKGFITKNKLLYVFVTIVLIVPLIRVSYLYCEFIPDVLRGSTHRSFETVADSLAIGGIMAIVPLINIEQTKCFQFFKNKLVLLLFIILSVQFLNSPHLVEIVGLKVRYLYNLIGLTIINCAIGLLLLIVTSKPEDTLFSKILNKRLMITIGLWSYSIYLWQQLWLYSWDIPLIFKYIGIFVCSVLSYYFIETKFLSWRDAYLAKNERN